MLTVCLLWINYSRLFSGLHLAKCGVQPCHALVRCFCFPIIRILYFNDSAKLRSMNHVSIKQRITQCNKLNSFSNEAFLVFYLTYEQRMLKFFCKCAIKGWFGVGNQITNLRLVILFFCKRTTTLKEAFLIWNSKPFWSCVWGFNFLDFI